MRTRSLLAGGAIAIAIAGATTFAASAMTGDEDPVVPAAPTEATPVPEPTEATPVPQPTDVTPVPRPTEATPVPPVINR